MHVSEVPTTHKSTITLLTLFPLLRNRLVLYHNSTFSSTINLDEMALADPAWARSCRSGGGEIHQGTRRSAELEAEAAGEAGGVRCGVHPGGDPDVIPSALERLPPIVGTVARSRFYFSITLYENSQAAGFQEGTRPRRMPSA